MSAKHTPGPWTRGFGNYVYQGERLGDQQRLIAVCEPTTKTKEDWDETFANARLIAAAPELLAALERYHEIIAGTGGKPLGFDEIRAAGAAIAKAKGGSQ